MFVLGHKTFQYRLRASHFWKFEGLPKPEDIKARSMLRHLVISEKDFLVWNRLDEVPWWRYDTVGRYSLEYLLKGMHLREAIETATVGIEGPLSLLSTLEKNVFFKRKDSS